MKISAQFVKHIFSSVLMVFLLAPITVLAQDDVILIPIVSRAKPLKNVITVAKAKGDFTDPVAAVNSIIDASASNPYLVVIGPGVYNLTQILVMKAYVDIVGSGENVTKLQGAISTSNHDASSAIISGANNAALSSLTVQNTGGSTYSIALYNDSAFPKVSHVTAKASGGTNNYGIFNFNSSWPTMIDVTAEGYGGTSAIGVYNSHYSWPTMTDVTAKASSGSANCGVYNYDNCSPTMTGVTAKASLGYYSYGVENSNTSSPTMIDMTVTASGWTDSYGVYNYSSSSPTIRRSTMEGTTYGLYTSGTSSTATLSQSTIIGGASAVSGGTNKCVACDNGDGGTLNNLTCN